MGVLAFCLVFFVLEIKGIPASQILLPQDRLISPHCSGITALCGLLLHLFVYISLTWYMHIPYVLFDYTNTMASSLLTDGRLRKEKKT